MQDPRHQSKPFAESPAGAPSARRSETTESTDEDDESSFADDALAARPSTAPLVRRAGMTPLAPREARVITIDDEEDDVAPTPLAAQGGDAVTELVAETSDDVVLGTEPPRLALAGADRPQAPFVRSAADERLALNDVYAARRLDAYVRRLHALQNVAETSPTSGDAGRPVVQFAPLTELPLVPLDNDTLLHLETFSPLVATPGLGLELGDAIGFSDTPLFVTGRSLIDERDERVSGRRLESPDADDIDAQTQAAARYQHSFAFTAGRYDVTLPVGELEAAGLARRDDPVPALVAKLPQPEIAGAEAEFGVVETLQAVGAGVAPLLLAYSQRALDDDAAYNALAHSHGTGDFVRRVLTTSLADARLATQLSRTEQLAEPRDDLGDAELRRLQALADVEETLADISEGSRVPKMLRVSAASGRAYVTVGDVAEYELGAPLESLGGAELIEELLAARTERANVRRALDSVAVSRPWLAALDGRDPGARSGPRRREEGRRQLVRRHVPVAEVLRLPPERTPVPPHDGPAMRVEEIAANKDAALVPTVRVRPPPAVKRRRRIAALREDEQIAAPGAKRRAEESEEGSALTDDEAIAGSDVESDALDEEYLQRELQDEGYERRGLDAARRIDAGAPALVRDLEYPALAVPIDWSARAALERIGAIAATPDKWRRADVWADVIALALYEKLVPRLDDGALFPAEARRALLDTLQLVAERIANEVVFWTENRRYFQARRRLERVRVVGPALREEEEIVARLATAAGDEAAALRRRLEELRETELPDEQQLPLDVLPALLVVRLPDAATTFGYLRPLAEPGALPPDKAVGYALAYATAAQRPDGPIETFRTQELAFDASDDYRYYPVDTSYAADGALEALFNDATSTRGIEAVGRYAAAVGAPLAHLDVRASRAGTVLRELYRERPNQLALAAAVYRQLDDDSHNRVKPVCLVSVDAGVSAAARAIAVRLMDQLFTQDGKFDTGDAIDINRAELERARERARAALVERGAERLVASAALQHVNERTAYPAYVVEQSAVVRADFQIDRPRDARPVHSYYYHEGALRVQADETRRLLLSRAYLGGGRVRVASVDRSLAIGVGRLRQAADRRLEEVRAQRAEVQARVDVFAEAVGDDGDPGTRRELAAAREKLAALDADEQRVGAELEEISEAESRAGSPRHEPFYLFCSPEVTMRVLGEVVAAATSEARVRQACRELLDWYAGAPLRSAAATLDDVLQYDRQLVRLDGALRHLVRQQAAFNADDDENNSLAAFVYAAATALSAPLPGASLLALPVQPTALANHVTQPFSELAALESAATPEREAFRDALFDVWYSLATQLRWERSGYFNAPFNSTRMLWLPAAGYETHETAHVALSLALRRLRAADLERAELSAYLDRDEGDSDSDEDDDDPHTAQLHTLRSALEAETTLLQAARTLWFDVGVVCAAGADFARLCEESLAALYAALVAQRPLAATNLLAATLDNETAPLAVDPRAQSLIADYWRAYGAADAEVARRDAVAAYYDEHSLEEAEPFYAIVDAAQDRVLASAAPAASASALAAVQREADTQREFVRRAQTNPLAARARRAPLEVSLEVIGRDDAQLGAQLAALLRAPAYEGADADAWQARVDAVRAQLGALDVRRRETSLELLASYSNEERTARIAELDAQIEERAREVDAVERENTALGRLRTRLRNAQARRRELQEQPVRSDYADQLSDIRTRADALRRRMLTTKRSEAPELLAQLARDEARLLALSAPAGEADARRTALEEHIAQLRAALATDADREALQEQVAAAQTEIAAIESDRRLRADAAKQQRTRRSEIAEYGATIDDLQTQVAREETRMRQTVGKLAPLQDAVVVYASQRRALLYADERARRLESARRVVAQLDRTEAEERDKSTPDRAVLAALRRRRAAAVRALNWLLSPAELRVDETEPVATVRRDLERRIADAWTPTLLAERDQRALPGAYDAPLANLKAASAAAVSVATRLMASQRLDDDTETLLGDESIEAVLACYNIVRPLFDGDNNRATGSEARLEKISAHIRLALQAAVERRVRARATALIAEDAAAGADERGKFVEARQAALAALARTSPPSGRALGTRPLSLAELAALHQSYRSYAARLRAHRTLNLINALGEQRFARAPPMPRLIAALLTPAAIERAKLQLQLDFENGRLPLHPPRSPYAVANAADAPQALRIDELVARFCLYHEAPFADSTPYAGYAAVRRAQPTLSRVAYMRQRTATLARGAGEQQLYSVGNGVHRAMPSAADVFLAALTVHLMRIHGALHDERSLDALYARTQRDAAQTRAIAALPSARTRLWLHLAGVFGERTRPIPGTAFRCALPVWREMRAADVRLLALVVLGFDSAPRLDADGEAARIGPQYVHLRALAAKHLLADAYYGALIDKFYRERGPTAIDEGADENEFENVLMLTYRRVISLDEDVQSLERVARVRRTVRIGTAAQPSRASGLTLAAAATEREARAAYDRRLRAEWTRDADAPPLARLASDTPEALADLVRDADSPYSGRLAALCNAALDDAVLVDQVSAAEAERTQIVRREPIDYRWLATPRAALVGVLVRRALAIATEPIAERTFARHAPRYDWERDNVLDALERLVALVEDSAHLLADDTADTAADLVERLVQAPLVPQPRALATQLPVIGAPVPLAPSSATPAVVRPNTDVGGWRADVERQLARLLDASAAELRGVQLKEPFATTDEPFAPLPVGVALLRYESIVGAGIDDVQGALESYIAPVLDEARRLFGAELAPAMAPERAAEIAAGWETPIDAQRQLLRLLVHAEAVRRRRWQLAGAQFADPTARSLADEQQQRGWFQPWHVLFFAALAGSFPATEQKPKDVLECYAAEPSPVQALARAELARRSVQPLALEQLVPVYDVLRCLFSRVAKKGAARTPNLLDQRHPLWQLLMAPRLGRFLVRVQTVDRRDQLGSSYVRLAHAAAGDVPCALFAPTYTLAHDRQALAAALDARTLASDDVLVTHEHRFTTSGAVRRGQRAAGTYVTLARVRAATTASLKRSLDTAQAAGLGVPIVGVPIPVVTYGE